MDEKNENKQRIEWDSVGSLEVSASAYYGVHSLRAAINFPITGLRVHPEMIRSIAQIKKAAALTNEEVGRLDSLRAGAIVQACEEIIEGKWRDQFIVDPIQGGAGTSLNMNANEVIANRALEILGHPKGDYAFLHPNDHVNYGQSTNDVFPSCGRLTVYRLLQKAEEALERLDAAFLQQAEAFDDVLKMGRTQLQDAIPIRLGQEFHAYHMAIRRDLQRFQQAKEEMTHLNLGGTAIGTGLNADIRYLERIIDRLSQVTGLPLRHAEDLIDATQNLDGYVLVSGIIKTCAVNLSKISNDLRLLSSGPRTGLGEIQLPARQNGSSIMPGKINPVIPEVVNQVAFQIIGNDLTITMAAEGGQLELNAFEPVIFFNLFQSAETLAHAVETLTDHCVLGITANRAHCRELVERSVGLVTALTPHIGYVKAAELAKESLRTGVSVRTLVQQQSLLPPQALDRILDPQQLTQPGIAGEELLERAHE